MKKKFSRILGVGLTIALLASLMVVATPASAGTLAYTTESLPSGVSYVIQTAAFGGIVDYAVAGDNGSTIYAVAGTTHVYKSTNGGSTWSRVDLTTLTGGVTWEFVAVAPDNPLVVAVGDVGGPAVWISTNGAATGNADSWTTAGVITAGGLALVTFRDLAISPAVNNVREVVAAGDKTGPLPAAFALNLGGTVASWTDTTAAGFGLGAVLGAAATTDIFAVAFSPNYISDRVIVAVSNDSAGDNFLNVARFTTAITGAWNAAAGFTDYTGATINNGIIRASTIVAPPAVLITSASLSLAPAYSGLDSTSRIAFVAINSGAPATSGVFRMNDAASKIISIAEQYSSVAFNGTNLVAGRSLDNVVYRSTDSLATTPTLTATTMAQRPSGGLGSLGALPTITRVAWTGTNVVATTLGNESAFSRSTDNGVTFNDVSQVATANTKITDFAVAADGSKWYMVTNDGADVSVWSKTGTTWERRMSIVAPATLTFTIRIAPENKDVVYIVNNGTTTIYYSPDGGDKNWSIRIANEVVTDLAVESANILYYVSGLNVRRSTNAGFLWSDPAVPALTAGASVSIRSVGTDKLIVTSATGVVSYSTNGGTSFTRLTTLTGGGSVIATATTLASGDYVYAVPGAGNALAAATIGVYRYTMGSVDPDKVWTQISPGTTATTVFTGLVLKGGILYAHSDDPAATISTLWRTLNPTDADTTVAFTGLPTSPAVATMPDFTLTGGRTGNLQLSTTTAGNTIWGIDNDAAAAEEAAADTATDEVYSLTDTVSTLPTKTAPADGATVQVNTVSGGSFAVTLSWNRPSLSTAYLVNVAFDSKFTQPAVVPFALVPADPAISPVSAVIAPGLLNPGTKYYWRVRATTPLLSPWSATGTFTTSGEVAFAIQSPAVGETNVSINPTLAWAAYAPGALNYEVMVSTEPTFLQVLEFSHTTANTWYQVTSDDTLDYSTIYYWRARAVTGAIPPRGTPPPGSPWLNGVFTTEAEPVEPTPPVVITPPSVPEIKIVQVPVEKVVPQAIPSYLLWAIIVIGAVLVIALIVLIVRTRRVA